MESGEEVKWGGVNKRVHNRDTIHTQTNTNTHTQTHTQMHTTDSVCMCVFEPKGVWVRTVCEQCVCVCVWAGVCVYIVSVCVFVCVCAWLD